MFSTAGINSKLNTSICTYGHSPTPATLPPRPGHTAEASGALTLDSVVSLTGQFSPRGTRALSLLGNGEHPNLLVSFPPPWAFLVIKLRALDII